MSANAYHFQFDNEVSMDEVEATWVMALLAVESLHGETGLQLSAPRFFDHESRKVVIESDSIVGKDLVRVFLGYLRREFAPEQIHVRPGPAELSNVVA